MVASIKPKLTQTQLKSQLRDLGMPLSGPVEVLEMRLEAATTGARPKPIDEHERSGLIHERSTLTTKAATLTEISDELSRSLADGYISSLRSLSGRIKRFFLRKGS